MSRLILVLIASVSCAAGLALLIGGAATWLSLHHGTIASDLIVGGILVLVGALIVAFAVLYRAPPRLAQLDLVRDGLGTLPERVFKSLGSEDLQGLALLCQRRPMLASLVALALGVGVGLNRSRERHD